MVRGWSKGLTPSARKLWSDVALWQRGHHDFGRFAATRSALALGRLSASSWNAYTSALKGFLTFLQEESLALADVTEHHLEMYVCWLAQSAVLLAAGTVASYLSAIRSCLKEIGIRLGNTDGTTGVLAGYRRLATAVRPAVVQHAAWPTAATISFMSMAMSFLPAFAAGRTTTAQTKMVIAAGHLVFASLTFGRGDTTNSVLFDHLVLHPRSFLVQLLKQKRPQPQLPQQQHTASTASLVDPVGFFLRFCAAQTQRGLATSDRIFALRTGHKTVISLDAAVKLAVSTLHLPPYTGHCVRVGCISEGFALGVPLLTLARMSGHKSSASTEGYVRPGVAVTASTSLFFSALLPAVARR